MFEFLIANGHDPESVKEYGWAKLNLMYEAAQRRVALSRLEERELLLSTTAMAQGATHKRGAKAINAELAAIRRERENLVASKDSRAQIEALADKLMRSGIPRR